MAATGNEAVKLSQLLTYKNSVDAAIAMKADSSSVPSLPLSIANGGTGSTTAASALENLGAVASPATAGSTGQVLTWNGTGTEWATISQGAAYTATAPIVLNGTDISVREAGNGTLGVVQFASDTDFAAYIAS